jgi:hypothetical protein
VETRRFFTFHFPLSTDNRSRWLTADRLPGQPRDDSIALQRFAAHRRAGWNSSADANFFQRWGWALQGVWRVLTEGALPIGRGDWYWFPSRVIPSGPGNEITEFPLFTFLYSDMHAHMLVMPLALFIIAWALSFVRARAQLTRGEWIASFGRRAVHRRIETDQYMGLVHVLFARRNCSSVYACSATLSGMIRFNLPNWAGKVFLALGAAGLLYVLGSLFYLPFSQWFGQAYNSVDFWQGSRTPFSSYFTQWGFFLFIITAWLVGKPANGWRRHPYHI